MNHHRILSAILCALLAAGLLAGCGASAGSGSTGASSAAARTTADYAAALEGARDADFNSAYTIFTREGEGAFGASAGTSADFAAGDADAQGQMAYELLGLSPEDAAACAFSASLMNIKSYGIAIVLPAEGKTEAVKATLQAFVQSQMQMQEHYLPDQYEIAKAGLVETLPSGEVVLVVCENAADVMASIKTALK